MCSELQRSGDAERLRLARSGGRETPGRKCRAGDIVGFPAVVFGESGQIAYTWLLQALTVFSLSYLSWWRRINSVYWDVLPGNGRHANAFHRISVRIESLLVDYDAYIATLRTERPIIYVGAAGLAARFLYTAGRPALGVYVEPIWPSAALVAARTEAVRTFNSKWRRR